MRAHLAAAGLLYSLPRGATGLSVFGGGGGCAITDAHGCCTSNGLFWCGSSGRCTYADDVCEDGLGAAMPCTLEVAGAAFDLSPLTLSTSQLDHVVLDSASTHGVMWMGDAL